MEKEFVIYEIAFELKKLGFDESCISLYKNKKLRYEIKDCNGIVDFYNEGGKVISYLAPTFSQAFRFFREKHNMLANVYSNASGFCYEYSDTIGGTHRLDSGFDGPNNSGCWDSYEEAELACLQKMIEIVKVK